MRVGLGSVAASVISPGWSHARGRAGAIGPGYVSCVPVSQCPSVPASQFEESQKCLWTVSTPGGTQTPPLRPPLSSGFPN